MQGPAGPNDKGKGVGRGKNKGKGRCTARQQSHLLAAAAANQGAPTDMDAMSVARGASGGTTATRAGKALLAPQAKAHTKAKQLIETLSLPAGLDKVNLTKARTSGLLARR